VTRKRVAWFTGLSGAGKTTIANLAAEMIRDHGQTVSVIDGDYVRSHLHRHLGFSDEDIKENNRLIAELCGEALSGHDVILVPIISPFRDSRKSARLALGGAFVEVYIRVSLDEAIRRDPKGLYRIAIDGMMPNLIGIAGGVPYEAPESADLALDTEKFDAETCARKLADYLAQ